MALARAVVTVGGLTLASRLLGFARDIITASLLGAGPVADAVFVALKLPNLFRRVVAEGALGAALVPRLVAAAASAGRPAALALAGRALTGLLLALAPATLLAVLGMPWLMRLIAPGFAGDPARFDLAVALTRITVPYLLLVSLAALLGAVLNAAGRFAVFAAAPILFNLVLIAALLLHTVAPFAPTAGHALAAGVTAAGVLQLLWLAWAGRRAGLTLRLAPPAGDAGTRRLFRGVAPTAFAGGIAQVNLFVAMQVASFLPAGAVSALYYADRLIQLPLGVVGAAVGTALLPLLSRHLAGGDAAAAAAAQSRAAEYGMALALPAAVALLVIPRPLVEGLFGHGAFGPEAVRATSRALAAFALALPAHVLARVWAAAYFARGETRAPALIAGLSALANLGLALALLGPLAETGAALAVGLAAWLNAGLLAWGLGRHGRLAVDDRLRRRLPRLAAAAAGMGAALVLGRHVLAAPLAAGGAAAIAALGLLVLGGGAVYAGLAVATGALRPDELGALLPKSRLDPGEAGRP